MGLFAGESSPCVCAQEDQSHDTNTVLYPESRMYHYIVALLARCICMYINARQATYNGNKSHECIDLDFGRVVYSVMPFSDTFINTNGGRLIEA
jgi:hypothetical protein